MTDDDGSIERDCAGEDEVGIDKTQDVMVDPTDNDKEETDRNYIENDSNKIKFSEIKKNMRIKFLMKGEKKERTGKILSRAGKANSKYKFYWNINDLLTNHTEPMNTELFEDIEIVPAEEEEIETYAVNIP